MDEPYQIDMLSPIRDVRLLQLLLADLHDDLDGKLSRFRQLADLSGALGASGTMLTGGEITYAAWTEARTSFIHGNYVATVVLCQSLAEHLLASELETGLNADNLPDRISFKETLRRSVARGILGESDAADLERLMHLRNPLSHYRSVNDPSNLSRRAIDTQLLAEDHLLSDATFAVSIAVRLLSLPAFRLDR